MLVLGSIPCESFCAEFRTPNKWPTFAPQQSLHRTAFPSTGEASVRCVYARDTWRTAFMQARIEVLARVRASSLADIDRTSRETTCDFSIVARSCGTIA